ncbi:MAG: hypothetical protein CVU38_00115 [Chloroflexi bacterium HGW-Chloroflexi-1]|nr:MAG: hypothetical protein CVU38_00115 [Chloroflexi bacterium HGW-Chloroflexi-1]
MSAEMLVVVDDVVSRYAQRRATEKRQTPQTILSLLLRRGYEAQIRKLHDQYQRGDITLRGMARRSGLSYRELYEELEKRSLPIQCTV